MTVRIGGLIFIVLGALITVAIAWLAQTFHFFPLRLAMMGPMAAGAGLGAVILGRGLFRDEQAENLSVGGWAFFAVGAIAGWLMTDAMKEGNFALLERFREKAAVAAGAKEQTITREEMLSATREVGALAEELKRRQAAFDPKDAAAQAKFNEDLATYTKRNDEVRALAARYKAQAEHDATLKGALVGAWRYEFEVSQGWTISDKVAGISTFESDGRTSVDAVIQSGKKDFHPHYNGHWTLEGNKLQISIDTTNPDSAEKPGETKEYLVREITATEFHYRDLKDGAELVRYRVGR